MCMVSMVSDYGQKVGIGNINITPGIGLPEWWKQQITPALPFPVVPDPSVYLPSVHTYPSLPEPVTNESVLKEFLKLLKQAAQFDAATNQAECEDPKKTAFLKGILERVETIDTELLALRHEINEMLNFNAKNV